MGSIVTYRWSTLALERTVLQQTWLVCLWLFREKQGRTRSVPIRDRVQKVVNEACFTEAEEEFYARCIEVKSHCGHFKWLWYDSLYHHQD